MYPEDAANVRTPRNPAPGKFGAGPLGPNRHDPAFGAMVENRARAGATDPNPDARSIIRSGLPSLGYGPKVGHYLEWPDGSRSWMPDRLSAEIAYHALADKYRPNGSPVSRDWSKPR